MSSQISHTHSESPARFRRSKARWRATVLPLVAITVFGLTVGAGAYSVPAAAAADTYYRWRDAQGKLVVSDRPPSDSGVEYEVVSQNSNLMRRVQPGEGAVPPEVNPRPGNEFEQVSKNPQRLEAIARNPESCARATANLETLNSTARIRIRDADTGELRFLSEEEKEVQRAKAQDIMRVHCGG